MKLKFLLFAFSIFCLFSCEKDDQEEEVKITTYQVINNTELNESDNISELNGTLYQVTVLKYRGEDLAGQDNLENPIEPNGGSSDVIEISDDIDKIKISFEFLPESSSYYDIVDLDRLYTASFTFLENGVNNEVVFDGNTLVKNNPSSSVNDEKEILSEFLER